MSDELRPLTPDEEQRLESLLSGKRTNEKHRIVPLSAQEAARMLDEAAGIMHRARKLVMCLRASKEARLVIQEIDEWTLRR